MNGGLLMSDSDNPYQTPGTEPVAAAATGDLTLPEDIREPLVKSASWMRFLGIVAFVFTGLIALLAILFLFGISFFEALLGDTGLGSGFSIVMGLVYLGIAALYFFPGLFLFRAGQSLKAYKETNSGSDLSTTFRNQSKLWKYIGVMSIISLGFIAVSMIVAAISAVAF